MSTIGTAAFILLSGLTLAGLVGSACELAFARRLSLATPFLDRRRILASLALAAACGPFMLVNDGIGAVREGRRGPLFLVLCGAAAIVWLFASGFVVADILGRIGGAGR